MSAERRGSVYLRSARSYSEDATPDREDDPRPVANNPKSRSPTTPEQREAARLRRRVRVELEAAGFVTKDGRLHHSDALTKQAIRGLHTRQRAAVLERARPFIERWEERVIEEFANGEEVNPRKIRPVVERVDGDGFEAALFRFATLHWSVPVSVGYGRRTRFLVRDATTGKLIGIFALGDPVYNLRCRDNLIGWGVKQRNARLYNVLDAFVLGALPPYRELLAGKLVAMAATSQETAALIAEKYQGTQTIISRTSKDPRPVLITTTSALGRSSLYNRLKYRNRLLFRPIGYTEGFGHFHFPDVLFDEFCEFLSNDGGVPSHEYGSGPNWRLRTIRHTLRKIGLDQELLHHGIHRQVFIAPLAIDWREYLLGETNSPRWYRLKLGEMAAFYRRRWAIPRAGRDSSYRSASREQMRLSTADVRGGRQ
jgi:hypothetical protein